MASEEQSPTIRDPIISISMETWVYQAARRIGRTGGWASGSPQKFNIQIPPTSRVGPGKLLSGQNCYPVQASLHP